MAKRQTEKSRRPKSKEEMRLEAIYSKSRRAFSAADLQKFTVEENGIPLQKIIVEMERIQGSQKRRRA
jgi:hypothetical protein